MAKRPNTSLVLAQDPKKARNDLVAYTNRDKALMEAVSRNFYQIEDKIFKNNKISNF